MRTPSLFLFVALALTACSGGELVGVHIDLAADGSGTVTLRALGETRDPTPGETRSGGANWTVRAALVASQGTFDAIGDLRLGDGSLRFSPQLDGDRPGLRVHLRRGPGTPWIDALAPDQATRRKLAKAYDPTGRTKEIGDVLRLEIAAPGNIVTSGVLPTGRGVDAGQEGKRAYLLLPVGTASEAGDDFVWDVSWLHK